MNWKTNGSPTGFSGRRHAPAEGNDRPLLSGGAASLLWPAGRTAVAVFLAFLLALPLMAAPEVEEEERFSQPELDQMLAPVALYPDALLAQILVAATYPLEVVAASRWSAAHADLEGEQAVDAAAEKEWDPSVKALLAFPSVLARMDEDLEWTQQLGEAFLLQEEEVMETVQALRQRADEAGNLDSLDRLTVTRKAEEIRIEPADPQIVYVPYYRTTVIYGDWWWPRHPPVYWSSPRGYYSETRLFWTRGTRLSTGFFFSTCDWRRRHVVVHHHHHHAHRSGSDWRRHASGERWRHEPRHRRGVAYRSDSLNRHYGRSGSSHFREATVAEAAEPRTSPRVVRSRSDRTRTPDLQRKVLRPERMNGVGDNSRRRAIARTEREQRARRTQAVRPPAQPGEAPARRASATTASQSKTPAPEKRIRRDFAQPRFQRTNGAPSARLSAQVQKNRSRSGRPEGRMKASRASGPARPAESAQKEEPRKKSPKQVKRSRRASKSSSSDLRRLSAAGVGARQLSYRSRQDRN